MMKQKFIQFKKADGAMREVKKSHRQQPVLPDSFWKVWWNISLLKWKRVIVAISVSNITHREMSSAFKEYEEIAGNLIEKELIQP